MLETSKRLWRQVGFWGLTLSATLGFPIVVLGVILRPEADWGALTGMYTPVLFAWVAAAGIRQWGKNSGAEGHD
jgi:Na+(H+)/acetate symporter ActP